jgi:hypothetical protein
MIDVKTEAAFRALLQALKVIRYECKNCTSAADEAIQEAERAINSIGVQK